MENWVKLRGGTEGVVEIILNFTVSDNKFLFYLLASCYTK